MLKRLKPVNGLRPIFNKILGMKKKESEDSNLFTCVFDPAEVLSDPAEDEVQKCC